MADQFSWSSALGGSVALFLASAGLMVFVGILAPFFISDKAADRSVSALFMTTRSDTQLFGADPASLVAADPVLARLRYLLLVALSGLLVATGVMELGLAWFGLREGHVWALAVLAAAGIAVLPFWYVVLRAYVVAGVTFGLADVPPFMWVPALLLIPAVSLGWLGLR